MDPPTLGQEFRRLVAARHSPLDRRDQTKMWSSGTVTFLFTDLDSSTSLWEEHPDAMQGSLARHDEILRAAIESHGGHVVKSAGDGIHAVFPDATGAVNAAVVAQLELAGERWRNVEPLQIRMELRTGDDAPVRSD
jgi:class 3 adenylate cyclase